MTTTLAVNRYMDTKPARIRSGSPLPDVIRTLGKHRVSGAPVVDKGDNIIGFVSEQDCLKQLLLGSYHCDQPNLVDDVMHTDVLTVQAHDSILDLGEKMLGAKPRIYPVVDAGRLVGVISRQQVLGALSAGHEQCGAW